MFARWLQLLLVSALLGLASCDLNPQPDLPGSRAGNDGASSNGAQGGSSPSPGGPVLGTSGSGGNTTSVPPEGEDPDKGSAGEGAALPADDAGGADGAGGAEDGALAGSGGEAGSAPHP
jgi:hypothetical protein